MWLRQLEHIRNITTVKRLRKITKDYTKGLGVKILDKFVTYYSKYNFYRIKYTAPLLADLFLYYYEADCMQELLRKKDKKLAISFNSTFRYIDDVLSLNNSKFGDYMERIYPIELEIKDTTDTVKSASYLDLHLEIDNEGRLKTKL